MCFPPAWSFLSAPFRTDCCPKGPAYGMRPDPLALPKTPVPSAWQGLDVRVGVPFRACLHVNPRGYPPNQASPRGDFLLLLTSQRHSVVLAFPASPKGRPHSVGVVIVFPSVSGVYLPFKNACAFCVSVTWSVCFYPTYPLMSWWRVSAC